LNKVLILAKRKLGAHKIFIRIWRRPNKNVHTNTKSRNVKQGFPCISWLYRNEPHQWTVKSILLQVQLIKMYETEAFDLFLKHIQRMLETCVKKW